MINKFYISKYISRDLFPLFYKLIPILFIISLLELISIGILLPIINLITNPNYINENSYLKSMFVFLNVKSLQVFIILLLFISFILIAIKNIIVVFLTWIQSKKIHESMNQIVFNNFYKLVNTPSNLVLTNDLSAIYTKIVSYPHFYINGVLLPLCVLITELILVTTTIGIILYLSPYVFIILMLVVSPLLIFYNKKFKSILNNHSKKFSKTNEIANSTIFETIYGYKELKIFNLLNNKLTRIKLAITESYNLTAKSYLLNYISPKIIEIFAVLCILLIAIIIFSFNYSLTYLSSVLIFTVLALYRLIPSFNKIILSINNIKLNEYTVHNFKDAFLTEKICTVDLNESVTNLKFNNQIEIRNLDFKFDKKFILKNFNLVIKKGQCIGIKGISGTGKSTLINILLRFLKESNGEILIDNINIEKLNLKEWYSIIGYVPQNIYLFNGSVLDNIILNQSTHNKLNLLNSIEMSGLKNFIESIPNGINYIIGENGKFISGGQRQRIAIARALYNNPEIIIFDEATNALDYDTECTINETILHLKQINKTIIIVSHTDTILKHVDSVYFMEKP